MSIIKALIKYVFNDPWTYSMDGSIRVHKDTGKTEYRNWDEYGAWYDTEPM